MLLSEKSSRPISFFFFRSSEDLRPDWIELASEWVPPFEFTDGGPEWALLLAGVAIDVERLLMEEDRLLLP